MDPVTEQIKTDLWAILELMGHDRTAGRYSFENGLHRVDVPDESGGFTTEMIGSGAIFRLRFVDEDAARLAAKSVRPQPIGVWELKKELQRLALPETSGVVEVAGPPFEFEDDGFEPHADDEDDDNIDLDEDNRPDYYDKW